MGCLQARGSRRIAQVDLGRIKPQFPKINQFALDTPTPLVPTGVVQGVANHHRTSLVSRAR